MNTQRPAPGHNSGTVLDVDTLVHRLEEAGNEWADAKAAADALEDSRKSVLAEALLASEGRTVGEREARALNAPKYLGHLDALAVVRKRANRARVRYDVEQVRIELIRTQSANDRAAMNLR